MKITHYCTLLLLIGTMSCYGNVAHTTKHIGLGIGKTLLGAFCLYTFLSVATWENTWDDFFKDGFKGNRLVIHGIDYYKDVRNNGARALIFDDNDSYRMNTSLMTIGSILSLIGLSYYGGYKFLFSAEASFKKAFTEEKPDTTSKEKPDTSSAAVLKEGSPTTKEETTSVTYAVE